MSSFQIDDLVREIKPKDFSAKVHGEGFRLIYDQGEVEEYRPRGFLWELLKNSCVQYFVCKLPQPKEIRDCMFTWSEGVANIDMEFSANFSIWVVNVDQARSLVKSLRRGSSFSAALFSLINAKLYHVMNEILQESDMNSSNILTYFRPTSMAAGEYVTLNTRVSRAVAEALGAEFKISFFLKSLPPIQIDLHQPDVFMLSDSKTDRNVHSRAQLRLSNYQTYKKSGLETEERIKEAISRTISQTIKRTLFTKSYFELVASYQASNSSVAKQIQEIIGAEARSIGYEVSSFHVFPDIAALMLLNEHRVEFISDKSLRLADNGGYVKIKLGMAVKLGSDISALSMLIKPEDSQAKIEEAIINLIKVSCHDEVQRYGREAFNLNFDKQVVPAVHEKVLGCLRQYGLEGRIIHIAQHPTEDALRYKALLGRTVDLDVEIQPHADCGTTESVKVYGKVEIIGMSQSKWSDFERKDFGFRDDSVLSWHQMQVRAKDYGLKYIDLPDDPESRRLLAIEIELAEIQQRVASCIQERLSKYEHLANKWRTEESSLSFCQIIEQTAEQAISDEFGLSVRLRAIRRGETASEAVAKSEREAKYKLAVKLADMDVQYAEAQQRLVYDKNLDYLKDVAEHRQGMLDAPDGFEAVWDSVKSILGEMNYPGRINRDSVQSQRKGRKYYKRTLSSPGKISDEHASREKGEEEE